VITVIEKKAIIIISAQEINTQKNFFNMFPLRKKSRYIKLNEGMTISVSGSLPKEINIGSDIKIISPAIKESVGTKVRYFAVNLLHSK